MSGSGTGEVISLKMRIGESLSQGFSVSQVWVLMLPSQGSVAWAFTSEAQFPCLENATRVPVEIESSAVYHVPVAVFSTEEAPEW